MSAIKDLDDALQERNKKTSEFLDTIVTIINQSVDRLPFCTRENSTPEVSDSVKVLKKDLDGIIAKIRDNSNIDDGAVAGLMNRLKLTNLRKAPPEDPARFSQDGSPRTSFVSASGSPRSSFTGSSPRPSDVDDLRFSADSQNELQPNSPYGYDFDQPLIYGPPSTPQKNGGKRSRSRRVRR